MKRSLAGIVAIDAEIVDRVAVDRIELDFLAVLENRLRGHRSRRDDVAVGEDQTALRIDHESGRLCGRIPFGIESAGAVDLDGHDAGGDARQGLRPVRGRSERSGSCRGGRRRNRVRNRGRGGGRRDGGCPRGAGRRGGRREARRQQGEYEKQRTLHADPNEPQCR